MHFDFLKQKLRSSSLAHYVWHWLKIATSLDYRKQSLELKERIRHWALSVDDLFDRPLGDGAKGVVAVFGWSTFDAVLAETVVRKSAELAGYQVKVLIDPTPGNRHLYQAMGTQDIESFYSFCPPLDVSEAQRVIDGIGSSDELLAFSYDGVAVGKYVSSTLMRKTRKGQIDLDLPQVRSDLVEPMAKSINAVRGALNLIQRCNLQKLIVIDRGYTPYGEVFDACIGANVDVVTWNMAHKDNALILKRYDQTNYLDHPSSLSKQSWDALVRDAWAPLKAEPDGHSISKKEGLLRTELFDAYNSGQWYGEVGTQFRKIAWKKKEIIERLDLDPSKKTAVIYSHIFWDATFFWGEDLFRDYEDWFVQTVKAACLNDNLNWLVKVHPANLVKNYRDGVRSEPAEIIALNEIVGALPDHVKVIPADIEFTTLSLIEATDYCLTVRGTVGIESALLGKVVITAGTGRYDRHGFTHDFASPEQYLAQLAQLEELTAPSKEMRDLAALYAYGVFLCRPLHFEVFDFYFQRDDLATLVTNFHQEGYETLAAVPEIKKLTDWLLRSELDYLECPNVQADQIN